MNITDGGKPLGRNHHHSAAYRKTTWEKPCMFTIYDNIVVMENHMGETSTTMEEKPRPFTSYWKTFGRNHV